MNEYAVIWDWAMAAARWLHIVTAIAWIGSSFYFIALDLGLRKAANLPKGAAGEEWQVHGGGFYHIQKYLVAPEAMPEHLTWFKWESYATWLSGAMLMALLYYGGADLFLMNREAWDVPSSVAILISIVSIAFAWALYEILCKSKFGEDNTKLMLALYGILVVIAWIYCQIFTGRAAFLHLGALTATIMSGNVFFTIIPNQKIVVADLKAGRTPDPKYGKIAKQRSTHNNYLTLPVIFMMLSNHYPMAFATEFNWIIASLIFLMGVTIRHFFNTMHSRKGYVWWTWVATVGLFFLVIMFSLWGSKVPDSETEVSELPARVQQFASNAHFDGAKQVINTRCVMCHNADPSYPGVRWTPKDVDLSNDAGILTHARAVYLQSGRSHAMPPGNVTMMEDRERALITAWFESAVSEGSVE
ncbi:urate hydroxylase PuuD [Paracoccaceae bacterium GXU_MW_L88]